MFSYELSHLHKIELISVCSYIYIIIYIYIYIYTYICYLYNYSYTCIMYRLIMSMLGLLCIKKLYAYSYIAIYYIQRSHKLYSVYTYACMYACMHGKAMCVAYVYICDHILENLPFKHIDQISVF